VKNAVQKAQAQTNVKLHGETRCRLSQCNGGVADDSGRLGRGALSWRGWLPTCRWIVFPTCSKVRQSTSKTAMLPFVEAPLFEGALGSGVVVPCILTHWGRVTQICVFTVQLCKTD